MVTLIAGAEPGLDRGVIRAAVTAVAGGRAKQRRTALALAGRPEILSDGRSPAPRAVGDLLIVLVKAGAAEISRPACAGCGKLLCTFQRRGDDWYCSVCSEVREPCAACGGRLRLQPGPGRPARCGKCPDRDGRDPVAVICGIVAALDPGAGRETDADAVRRSAPRPSSQQKLAWALEVNLALLAGMPPLPPRADPRCSRRWTGRASPAPLPPPCGPCGCNVVRIDKPLGGVRRRPVLRGQSRARARYAVRGAGNPPPETPGPPRWRTAWSATWSTLKSARTVDAAGRNTCSPEGPLCPGCPPPPALGCSGCGRDRRCWISRLTRLPWRPPCQAHPARRAVRPGQAGRLGNGETAPPGLTARFPVRPAWRTARARPVRRLPGQRRSPISGRPGGRHLPALRPLREVLAATTCL